MELTPYKLHTIIGLVLIIAGFAFDIAFVTKNITEAFKNDPANYLNSWSRYVFDFVKLYLFVLGFLNISFAILIDSSGTYQQIDWIILGLMAFGSLLFIIGGIWEALIGPVFEMEPPCYVLVSGLLAILLSITIKIYKLAG